MKLEKLTIGNFLSFVEAGETIDGVTVSAAAFPDNDPPENWPSLGAISETDFEAEVETDTDYIASLSGGYIKEDDERVLSDYIKFKSRDMSELVWRLQLGLRDKITNGTAQTPFASKVRFIDGWLRVQAKAQDGLDRVVMNVWGRLRLDENPKYSKDPTKPGLKFQVLYSSIAEVTPENII